MISPIPMKKDMAFRFNEFSLTPNSPVKTFNEMQEKRGN